MSADSEIFSLELDSVEHRHVVRLVGELDLSSKPALDAALGRALASEDGHGLIIDLRRLEFIDSSGIHSLVVALREATRTGRSLVAIRGGSAIARVLSLSGLDGRLTMSDDLDRALALSATGSGRSAAAAA